MNGSIGFEPKSAFKMYVVLSLMHKMKPSLGLWSGDSPMERKDIETEVYQ